MDNTSQILKQFIIDEFLSQHGMETLEADYPLVEEGIIDSLGIIILIGFIEERFGVTIRSNEFVLNNFESLSTISDIVNHKIQERGQ